MLYKSKPEYETKTRVDLRPSRAFSLKSKWEEAPPGSPWRGRLIQSRKGEVAPFWDKSPRETKNRLLYDTEGVIYSEEGTESARQVFIAAYETWQDADRPQTGPLWVKLENALKVWLIAIESIQENHSYRNRVRPQVWGSARTTKEVTPQSEGSYVDMYAIETVIKKSLKVEGSIPWGYANWNVLNFWTLPSLDVAYGYLASQGLDPEDPEHEDSPPPGVSGRSPLTALIEHSRQRAILWENETGLPGTDSRDRYGTKDGSFTVEFWINPRVHPNAAEPAVILSSAEHLTIALDPIKDTPVDVDGVPEWRYRLLLVSPNKLTTDTPSRPLKDILEDEYQRIGRTSSIWSNGWVSSAPYVVRGKWNHCVVSYSTTAKQLTMSINGEVAYSRIFSNNPNPRLWWPNGDLEPEKFLSMGARVSPELIPYALDPAYSPFEIGVGRPSLQEASPSDVAFLDPLQAELHSFRIWDGVFNSATLRSYFGKELPAHIAPSLVFDVDFCFRSDSPSRPQPSISGPYKVSQEKLPVNGEIMWEYASQVANLEGYLYDRAGDTWGVPVGNLSAAVELPDTTSYPEGRVEVDGLFHSLFGYRTLSILPNDNPISVEMSLGFIRERWKALDFKLREERPSLMILADDWLAPAYPVPPVVVDHPDFDRGEVEIGSSDSPTCQVYVKTKDRKSRATTHFTIPNIYFGSRISKRGFVWQVDLVREWLINYLNTASPLPADPANPGGPLEPLDPNPVLATAYLEALDSERVTRVPLRMEVHPYTIDNHSSMVGTLIRSQKQNPEYEDNSRSVDLEDSIRSEDGTGVLSKEGARGAGWSVGSIDLINGVGAFHHPSLWRAGWRDLYLALEGNNPIFVREFLLPAPPGVWVSQNPSWESFYAAEEFLPSRDPAPFVDNEITTAITEITMYDKNLNAVAKTHVAQPIYRTPVDRLAFKTKLDF